MTAKSVTPAFKHINCSHMEVALAWLRYAELPSPTNSSCRHQDGGLHPNTAPSRSNTAAAASYLGLCPVESGQSPGMETPFSGPH